ncbi:MAG: peptidase S10, partial [Anaerolineae bacterium]|nr:peptidase S10 [Anaerolineae bacterium]
MSENEKPLELYPDRPSVTMHSLQLGDKTLNYRVTAGTMPLKNAETGETEGHIFYAAYTAEANNPGRPLMFAFNGGPGSASVWLHLGALGPKRVQMLDDGGMPAPPYHLVENPHTWLEFTDLVFIDPIGTGYSRATKTDHNKKFWGLEGDFQSVGEFIRLYLSQNGRWNSPLFLVGESYGTTRAAGLAGQLIEKGIAFNGVLLISTILNFQTARFTVGNDLPYLLFLPTYTASAWYHQKLPADLQQRPLLEVLSEVEAWLASDYNIALMKGDSLPDEERQQVIQQLARYTGLDPRFIDHSNLRVEIFRFCKELRRSEKRTVGRLDSRFEGLDALPVTEKPDFDPSMTAITPPYTAMMNQYARVELGFQTDVEYEVLSFKVNKDWDWGKNGFPDTSEMLRSAFARNPHMKLFVAQGYYDLATPYYAALYTLNHMGV